MTDRDCSRRAHIVVRVYFNDIPMGFYRARHINHEGLLLAHGPIVFPEGSDVTVEFFDRLGAPRFRLNATIVNRDAEGMRVSFDFKAGQGRPGDRWVVEWEMPQGSQRSRSIKE